MTGMISASILPTEVHPSLWGSTEFHCLTISFRLSKVRLSHSPDRSCSFVILRTTNPDPAPSTLPPVIFTAPSVAIRRAMPSLQKSTGRTSLNSSVIMWSRIGLIVPSLVILQSGQINVVGEGIPYIRHSAFVSAWLSLTAWQSASRMYSRGIWTRSDRSFDAQRIRPRSVLRRPDHHDWVQWQTASRIRS